MALTSVDRTEGEPEKAVIVRVLLELSADRLCKLYSLSRNSRTADVDCVGVDVTAGAGPVTVGDSPGGSSQPLCCARLGWVVDTVSRLCRTRELG